MCQRFSHSVFTLLPSSNVAGSSASGTGESYLPALSSLIGNNSNILYHTYGVWVKPITYTCDLSPFINSIFYSLTGISVILPLH